MTDYTAELAAIEKLRSMGATKASAGAVHAEFPPLPVVGEPEKGTRQAEALNRREREELSRLREQLEMEEELGNV
jgi:hypothetical protein